MNNLVYFWDYSGWAYNYDSFLGYWGNNLVFFLRSILAGPIIMIVFWLVCDYDSFLGY